MPPSGPFSSAPPPLPVRRRRGLGCFPLGCVLVLLVLLGLGGLFGWLGWLATQGGQAFISERQVLARTATATDEQYQALLSKMAPFGQAMKDGRAATLELTPDDLNVLIARSPQFKEWRGRLFLSATGDRITADVSTPLSKDEDHAYFFNGRVTLDASYASNGFAFLLRRIEPLDKGEAHTRFANFLNSPLILQAFSQQISGGVNDGIHQQAESDPATAELLRRLATAIVQDGKIVVTLREQPGSSAVIPTPTPVAAEDNQT